MAVFAAQRAGRCRDRRYTGVWFSEWWSVVNGAGTTSYEEEFYDYDGGNEGTWSTRNFGHVPAPDHDEAAVDPPSYAFVTPFDVCVSGMPHEDRDIT